MEPNEPTNKHNINSINKHNINSINIHNNDSTIQTPIKPTNQSDSNQKLTDNNQQVRMPIKIAARGRNVIPEIKPANIITIHGKNGVGKSMASTLLEIASGNYTFESVGHFNKLKQVIKACNIRFGVDENNHYDVELRPHLWQFDANLNRVNPVTLGIFTWNQEPISYEDFHHALYIKTIRGNESLQQQILFFKDIFLAKISQKIEHLEHKLVYLDHYQEWLSGICQEDLIHNYQKLQTEYSEILDKHRNLESATTFRQSDIQTLHNQESNLQQLFLYLQTDLSGLPAEHVSLEQNIAIIKEERNKLIKTQNDLKKRKDELLQKRDQSTNKALRQLPKLKKQKEVVAKEISPIFAPNIVSDGNSDQVSRLNFDNTFDVKSDVSIKAEIQQIQTVITEKEKENKDLKKKIELLHQKHEKILLMNQYLEKLHEVCKKALSADFADEKIITGDLGGQAITCSFKDIHELLAANEIQFQEREELSRYRDIVKGINHEIIANKHILQNLEKYAEITDKIVRIETKLKGHHSLDDFINIEDQIAGLEKQLTQNEKEISTFDQQLHEFKNQLDTIQIKQQKFAKLPSKSKILQQLRTYNLKNPPETAADCEKLLKKISSELRENQTKQEENQKKLKAVKQQIDTYQQQLDGYQQQLEAGMTKLKFRDIGSFIDYFFTHKQQFQNYLAQSTDLLNKLNGLHQDIIRVLDGKTTRVKANEQIIKTEFDRLFKDIYAQQPFFDYVFKDYQQILSFDIINKSLHFRHKDGYEEERSLDEFSSGEKTYAYCRSVISMTSGVARYNIVILDESYALLDQDHSQDLYDFQLEMINAGKITKFINILPLKENLQEYHENLTNLLEYAQKIGDQNQVQNISPQLDMVSQYIQEVSKFGYYQEEHGSGALLQTPLSIFSSLPPQIPGQNIHQSPIVSFEEETYPYCFYLDGSNIARDNNNSKVASITDVLRLKQKLMEYGVDEKYIFIIFGSGLKYHLVESEKTLYDRILTDRNVNQAPASTNDDWFIIEMAARNQGFIISNDLFRDFQQNYPELARFLKEHTIHYSIIGTQVSFQEGFGKKVKEILKQ